MKKISILLALLLIATALTACGGDDVDITINKVVSGVEENSDITVIEKGESLPSTENSSETVSRDESSKQTTSSKEEIPSEVLSVADFAAKYFFPESAETNFTFYSDGIQTIGGYPCHVVEVFDSANTFLAIYAVSTEYDGVYFAYDNDNEKYRIMTIGNDVVIGDFADTLVSHGVYTNQPAGYTFSYDGEPEIATDFNVTVFETPLWLLAIEGEVPTASLSFSDPAVREAQEETVMRQMLERLGFEFDWVLESDTVQIGGDTFVRRPFYAEYGNTTVEIGTVYYGYAKNGMFYKIVAFSVGETNSVSDLLERIAFVDRVEGGTVRDERTQSKEPSRPNGADENGDTSSEGEHNDRPFGW